jgi:hypothetical protein
LDEAEGKDTWQQKVSQHEMHDLTKRTTGEERDMMEAI